MTAPVDGSPDLAAGAVAYPAHWAADVVLRDGSVAHLRPIRPEDADGVRRFHAAQSDESIYLRFFAPLRELSDRDVSRFTTVDYVHRVAMVATVREAIIGIARYDQIDATSAEVALNIADTFHGRGVGSVLLEHLVAIAQEHGISNFVAEVLPQNRKMLKVFSDTGYAVSNHYDDGVVFVSFRIEPTAESEQVRVRREHDSEAVSVRSLLHPTSIAVVGASRRADAVGHRLLDNIVCGGFTGSVYAVNSGAEIVQGRPAFARVSDIPEHVDLAVIAVPAESVLDVVADCARAGVGSLVVASAGFAESGPGGDERQAELQRLARGAGMRVVGPSSVGVSNSAPEVQLNATLAATLPPPGGLGLFTQSGALGIAVLSWAARRHLGVSSFVSAGNRVDVSGNDLMQYWLDDDSTLAVGMYLESMGNPRKFSRLARRLAARKPVIVVKAMVTSYNAPPGHRVRRTGASPEAFEAMLRQAGVIRVEDLHQLFDVAQLVVHQPLPRGRRVAVVGNSAAMGALAAEACVGWGLQIAHGPVSVPTEVSSGQFADALAAAFADPHVDSVMACLIPPLVTSDTEMASVVADLAARSDKTCLATFLGMRGRTRDLSEGIPEEVAHRAVPAYALPEDAARALAAATNYGEWRDREWGTRVAPAGLDRPAARAIVDDVLRDSPAGRSLTGAEVEALLAAYGIALWASVPAADADEAVQAAERIGYPVVVKSVAPALRHSVGYSGVRVDLKSPMAVREAFEALTDRLAAQDADHLVVQRMAAPGVACVVSASEDELFGPVVAFSVAGPPSELLGDIAYRIPPLTDVDVRDLVSAVRAAPLLHGHRGAAPVDDAALRDLIARVSVLTDDLPELASLELNPAVAHPAGIAVLGAEARVAPAQVRGDTAKRALT